MKTEAFSDKIETKVDATQCIVGVYYFQNAIIYPNLLFFYNMALNLSGTSNYLFMLLFRVFRSFF